MKCLSMDIETTGLDPATCQIIQIGAVVVDTDAHTAVDDAYAVGQCIAAWLKENP